MTDPAGDNPTTSDLVTSDIIENTPVYNQSGTKIGKVYSLVVHKRTGQVAYAVILGGGFLGIGEHCYPIPWNILSYVETPQSFVVDITKDKFAQSPKYDRAHQPRYDHAYKNMINDFYGLRR